MSYLQQMPDGIPDFNKAVISLWFRVPQTSMDMARGMYDNDETGKPMMGVIPLMVFGKRLKIKGLSFPGVVLTSYNYTIQTWSNLSCSWETNPGFPTTNPIGASQWKFSGAEFDIEPSHIGIDCRDDPVVLSVNLQTNDYGTFDGSFPNMVALAHPGEMVDWPPPFSSFNPDGTPVCSNFPATDEDGHVVPERSIHTTATYASAASVVINKIPERFRTVPDSSGLPGVVTYAGPEITPDHWHHLLLSFDLTRACSVQGTYLESGGPHGDEVGTVASASQMWIALDDVNLTRKELSAYWPDGSGNPNAVLTPNTYFTYRDVTAFDQWHPEAFNNERGNIISQTVLGLSIPTGEYQPTMIPAANEKFGIPATDDYVDFILPVEMAEFQLFTNVAIDTGNETNRRAFIENGVPVSPTEHQLIDEDTGLPVLDGEGNPIIRPPPAEDLLGQKPDILLHGSGNWSRGINTGPPKVPDPVTGEPVFDASKALTPTGKIVSYSPDPSLSGPQKPADDQVRLMRAAR